MTRSRIIQSSIGLFLIFLVLLAASIPSVHSASYNMKYDLTYTGVPFAGGAIDLVSNFNNTGQLTIRVTSISFASDFWSNGTRFLTSGLLFNLTTGSTKQIDTPTAIPSNATIGNHIVAATASWQFSNSTGWFNASSIDASITVAVSQTIGSLFASYATVLIIALIVFAIIVVLVVFGLSLKKRRSESQASQSAPSR